MTTIDQFKGEYAWLSNFHIEADGFSLEHRFQAAKTLDPAEAAVILAQSTPGKAKRAGRREATLRADWEDVKLEVMRGLVEAKFRDPVLRAKLDATGDVELREGNYWNDTYWGVSLKTGKGWNRLGQILMDVRAANRAAMDAQCESCELRPAVVLAVVDSESPDAVSAACGECALVALGVWASGELELRLP